MKALSKLLKKLREENLHGATTYVTPTEQTPATDGTWTLVDAIDTEDLDAKDPRWFELFLQFFLSEEHADSHDDLLFFVRAKPMSSNGMPAPDSPGQDPVFVRRRVSNQLPVLDGIVDWKQTIFLNLVVQVPCVLTVAVCHKMALPRPDPSVLTLTTSQNAQTTVKETKPKSKMMALRRVSKKVYAAPYKSRMDVKDAFMNECSFPLIYYTVNDYESHDLHLPITEKQYLCVELAIWISPDGASMLPDMDVMSTNDDKTPFPVPEGYEKVVLFQGAVPYSALLDVYQQKGSQSGLSSFWNTARRKASLDNLKGSLGSLHENAERDVKMEYIMMRGPHGKGQCQVAISEKQQPKQENDMMNNSSQPLTLTDRLKSLGKYVQSQVASNMMAEGITMDAKRLPELDASMTFVNVPWQSIVSDLMDYSKKFSAASCE